jgi:hypothetical protein
MNRPFLFLIVFACIMMGVMMGVMYISFDVADRLYDTGSYEEKIRKEGIEADAKIISIDDALFFGGVSIDEMKYLEVKMEIDNGIDEPYIIAIDTTIPKDKSLNVGDVIPVVVDSDNRRKVVFDYNRAE